MSVKINSLEFENVKRIKAVQLEPVKNGLTVIGIDYKTWIDVAMAGNIIIMLIMAGMDD